MNQPQLGATTRVPTSRQISRSREWLPHRSGRTATCNCCSWALYDGRATAEENWEERTGLAVGDGNGGFVPAGSSPLLQSPHAPFGLRYADVVVLPQGGARWFYEATRPDGAHELRTVLLAG